jgi:hypothetical protein
MVFRTFNDPPERAELNSTGVLKNTQLPDLSITSIDVVPDQTARLNLDAEEGDVAIQTDISETFILSTKDPSVNSNWKKVQLDVTGAIDGEVITPAQLGTGANRATVFADQIDSLGGFFKNKTRAELSSSSSATPVPFDVAVFDSSNALNTSTGEITVPETGTYMLSIHARTTGEKIELQYRLNGTLQSAAGAAQSSQSLNTANIATLREFAQGDSITVENFSASTILGGPNTFLTLLQLA